MEPCTSSFPVPHYLTGCSLISVDKCTVGCILVWTRDKKNVVSSARHDVFCRQTFKVVAPDQRVPLISLIHFSQLAGIFLAQKQHTCLQKVFLTSKNACKEYFVEQKQIQSRTQSPQALLPAIGRQERL